MAYTYSAIVNGTTFNLEEMVDSRTLKIVKPFCSTKKTSGKGTMSVVIRGAANKVAYQNFMQAFLASQYAKTVNDCSITVSKDGTPVFIGYLDKSTIDIVSKKIPQDLTLSANDKSSLLDEKIRYNHIYATGGAGQSRNAIVRDLLSKLSTDSGITVSLVSTDLSDADICAPFAITEDKSETYRDVIDRILLEAIGYVLVFDPSVNGFRIKKIPTDIVGVTPREVSYLVNDSLRTKSAIYEKDGILLSFPNIVRRENTNLYSENISLKIDDNGYIEGTKVQPGEYYPPIADVVKVYQKFRMADRPYISGESRLQNEDLELLFATGVSVGLASNPNLILSPALPSVEWAGDVEYLPTKARAIYLNDSNKESNITDFTYTGTATYIDSYNKVTYPKACVKPEEYTAKTIIDADKAKRFACWLYNSKNYGETTSQWAEYDSSAYLGEIVNVIHKGTGVQMPHVIVQITDESVSGTRVRKSSIIAISIYSWSAYDEEDASLIETLSPSNPSGEAKLIKTLPQYYHSYSLDSLVPNVFVVTSDTERQNGKTYYEFDRFIGFYPTEDLSFVQGKTYYEDASWLDHIVERTGGIYYVNGHLVPTQDSTPQIGKTYYYYDSVEEEYVVFEGSTFDPNVAYFEYEEYPSYVWHRQKYIYSNGEVAYSAYAYYLTTADVANPFTVTSEFAVSTADHFVVTSDSTPNSSKVYYTNVTGKWTVIETVNNQFPAGMNPNDIYEIENVTAWVQGAIPASWKSGLYVWIRETVTYNNKPESPIVQIPYYSSFHTQEMEKTCKFEVSLSTYSWNKNRRQSSDAQNITINISYNIQGYSTTEEPLHLSLSVTPNTGVTVDPNAQFFSFPSDIAQDALLVRVSSIEYPSIVREFTVTCVDITEKATYFGILNADPSFSNTGVYQFIEGDHFVAQGIQGKISLMPYVYHNGAWELLSDSIQKYGDVVRENILADSAADIFNNAEWVYTQCSSGDKAQAGVDYFELNQDSEYVPVIVQIGEDVSSYYTRQKNIPPVIHSYYRYNAKLIASYISANDIQLTDETDPNTGAVSVGQIRSAGYQKGTVEQIIKAVKANRPIDNFRQGFYGSSDGHFEAFKAWLYQATIYNANITGELRNDLFLTQLEPQSGEDFYLNPLSDESWSGTKAIAAVKAALAADGKGEETSPNVYNGLYEIVPMSAAYPTQNDTYNYGMLVEDLLHEHDSSSIAGDGQFIMPIRANVDIYQGKFFDTNDAEIPTGTDLTRGTVLKNIKRWTIADIYNHASLSKNRIYSASGSFAGTSFSRLACVSSTGYKALDATSSSRQTSDRNEPGNWSFTAPTSYRNSGTRMSVTVSGETNHGINTVLWTDYRWEGNVRIYVNGSLQASWTGVKGGKQKFNFLTFSWSGTVTAGDVVNVQIDSSGQDRSGWALHNGDVTVTFAEQTFSQIGCTSNGVWKWNGSSWSNLGTDTERFQENDTIHTGQPLSMSSPISWSSADNLIPAQLKYNFSKYQVGLNLVSSDGTRQQTVVAGAHPISEYFACVYNSVSIYNSANATHYFHYAGLWKYAKCPIPLTAFESGKTYYEENSGTYTATSDSSPSSTKQYYLKEVVESGSIYSVESSSLAYKKYDQNRHPASGSLTDAKTIIWQTGQILIEGTTEISVIQSSEWLEMMDFTFKSLASSRGNYADTIVPIEAENVREHEINLGAEDNAFDNAFVKKIGSENKPVQTANINQLGTIVPISGAVLSAFDVTLVYYELNSSGFYEVTEDVTPNAGKTYYVIYPTTDAYVKNLWEVNNQQAKLIRDLYVKISQVEQSLSSSTTMIPSSKAVTDAIMNISSGIVVRNYTINNPNTPTGNPQDSLTWLLNNGYRNWFNRGSVIHFTANPNQGYRTFFIGGTDPSYFSALQIDYYRWPDLLYLRYTNGTWHSRTI